MNYTISQLKIFLKITETQSVTKASEELHLTQPAVSIQLKNLQAQFEIPLTEIVGRKIFITDFGREIAVAAERILNEVNAINYKTLAHKGKLSGNLKISVVSTGQYIIPYFLSGFLKQHESIDLQLDVNKSQVTIFETLPLIYREAGSGTRHVMEKFILKNKLPVKKKMELTSNEAVKQAVIAGMGYSIMPLIGIKNELTNGELQIIPVKGFPIRSVWNLIWLKEKGFSVVANSFLTYLKSEKQNIIRERFDWFDSYAAK